MCPKVYELASETAAVTGLRSAPNSSCLQVAHSTAIAPLRWAASRRGMSFLTHPAAVAATIAPIELAGQEVLQWKRSVSLSVVPGAQSSPPSRMQSATLAPYSPPAGNLKSLARRWRAE